VSVNNTQFRKINDDKKVQRLQLLTEDFELTIAVGCTMNVCSSTLIHAVISFSIHLC